MAALELKLLGDLEVCRGGQALELPPSRKTRALLAYLALNARPFRREHLCELLWDISDDPRGSLRWSLSKLRRLVDDESVQRIVADRITVRFDPQGTLMDVLAHAQIAGSDLTQCSIEVLESAVRQYRGHFLEDLALPNFQTFDAWCVAQREAASGAQARLLTALIRRLAEDPARALSHARSLVTLVPYDEPARALLVRLLMKLGRVDQAEQQYETGMRMLKEAGAASSGELFRAWRGTPGAAPTVRNASEARSTLKSPETKEVSAPQHPLVGRDAELARIDAALQNVIDARSARALLICGEPGIGKSRLLQALADRAQAAGALVLRARAYASESIRPFALWMDALTALGPEVASAVFAGRDQISRERLFSTLGELISARAERQSLVLVFDDLQWSDESSAAALHYVMRTNTHCALLAVFAARSDEIRDNTPVQRTLREFRLGGLLETIDLGPLSLEAVHALIATQRASADTQRLWRASGGNPLLAIELARAEEAGDSAGSLSELIQERLARCDASSGELLHWAAVLAPRIEARLLAPLTGLDWNRIGEVLELAAGHAILRPSERGFVFSHDLIARSIYASLSPARRRTMHRRVAELLEHDTALDLSRAADLAHHAAQSGDAALAARAMVRAGKLCLRFFANDEAMVLARKGLAWAEQLGERERICLTLELSEVLLAAGPLQDRESAALLYAQLAEQALDHGALAHARRGYFMASYVRWMQGEWTAAREEVLQSERVARGSSDEEHVVAMAEAARCLVMLERDLAHADAMLMEAQALANRKRITHCAIPGAVGMLRFHEGRFEEAAELLREARTLARARGDRLSEFQAIEYLVMLELERGWHAAAQAHCAALTELGEKLREGSEGPFSKALQGLCRYALADDSSMLDEALDPLRAVDAKHRLAYVLTRAALIDLERQRPKVAITRATEALRYARVLGRATETLLSHVALARAHAALGETDACAANAAKLASFDTGLVALWARERAAGISDLAKRASEHSMSSMEVRHD